MSHAVPFGLTVPTDERFREMVRAFSVRVAASLGYAEGDARAIGQIVEQVVEGVTEYAFQGVPHEAIQIRFATDAREMEICLRYRGSPDTRSGATAGRVERGLLRQRDGTVPLEAMRRVMEKVEFGRDEDAEFCRLTRPLPDRV